MESGIGRGVAMLRVALYVFTFERGRKGEDIGGRCVLGHGTGAQVRQVRYSNLAGMCELVDVELERKMRLDGYIYVVSIGGLEKK